MGTIIFSNYGISPEIKHKAELKKALSAIFTNENVVFKRIHYIFCKDDYLLNLNRQYLGHDTYTDILTFTLSSQGNQIISEIYISIERVLENASLENTIYNQELNRVMIHGILHLCGYSDHTPKAKLIMRKKEDFYLDTLVFT